jgi:hypothetical protein
MNTDTKTIPLWHSLMYSTGYLLIVCGIPATIVLSLMWKPFRISRSDAILGGLCMIIAELLVAGVLLSVAKCITKRQTAVSPTGGSKQKETSA